MPLGGSAGRGPGEDRSGHGGRLVQVGGGLHVEARQHPVEPGREPAVGYRIVQESLTNVVKHAGPGAKTCVRLSADSRCLTVEVTERRPRRHGAPGSSHGISGMRERAHLLGGTLEVGPRAERGFSVRAQLPMSGVTA